MKRSRNERGIALLMVITCLFALMVIAVPFAITMRLGLERSETHNARGRAKQITDSTIRFLEASLVRTTERVEIERFNQQIIDVTADPECDPQSEIEPTLRQLADTLSMDPAELQNPYGVIVGWSVEDENGKLNINNCSPFALGNLLGMSPLAAELTESASEIQLEDATKFPARGYVKVGRELIKYTGKSGNALTGCERNVGSVLPEHKRATGEGDVNKTGRMVVNYAAWAISYYAVGRHRGEYSRFDGLDVSDISRMVELDPEVPVLTKADWDKVLPFVTAWSRGESADTWSNAQPIQEGTILPQSADTFDGFLYGNSYFYNPGTILRISERVDTDSASESVRTGFRTSMKSRRNDYAMCFGTTRSATTESQMRLYGKVHRKFGQSQKMVESLVRQPVNINTAPHEVLFAIFNGLCYRNRLEHRVTPEIADKLAERIIARREDGTPLRSFKEFRALLSDMQNKEGLLTEIQNLAIYRNAINSHDNQLEFGTAPICFRTFDVYTLRASATVNDRGGRQLAKHSSTRVVEIGSQVTASRIWSSQRDFEQQVFTVNDARFWTTGPFNAGWFVAPNMEPTPRWQRGAYRNIFANDPYAHEEKRDTETERTSGFGQVTTDGQIALSTARMMYDMVGQSLSELRPVEHFDRSDYAEGEWVDEGLVIPASAGLARARNDEVMLPFYIEFWWQPARDASGDYWLFDTAEGDHRNRVTCYVDGENSELVFAVADNTEVERSCEIRAPLDEIGGIVQRVWYHVALCATGCHPSEMQMWIDGRAIGTHNVSTSLIGNIQPDSASIGVESTEGFPEEGALLIGNEVIEYESASGGQFVVRSSDGNPIGRGKRGTFASDHLEGTPVVLFGYSRTLMQDALTGSGTQVGDLGPWSVVRFDTPAQIALLDPNASGSGQPFQNYSPSVVSGVSWQIQSTQPGMGASPLNTPLVPLQGNPNATPPTTITPFLIPFENDGSISGFGTLKYSPNTTDSYEETENEMRAFQEDGYCYVIYTGGTLDDWSTFLDGGQDNIRAVAEFMRYTYDGSSSTGGLTLTRLSDNDGSQTARERESEWYMLAGYTRVNGQDPSRFAHCDILVVPVSYKAEGLSDEGFINPVTDDDYTHWFFQVLQEDDGVTGGNEEPWEWMRYSEILDSDAGSFFLQAYFPNEALLTDTLTNPSWSPSYVQALKTPLPTVATLVMPNSSTSVAANYIRFRGIQDDRNRNGRVDDWWGTGVDDADDQIIPEGSLVLPVHACYGGPDPDTGLAGEDYSVWPLPGRLDLVDLVTGDDEARVGQIRVHHGMDGLSNRLYEDTDGAGGGDEPPVDFDIEGRVHLFAMQRGLDQKISVSAVALDDPGGNADDPRRFSRIICFPSGEMPDNLAAMTPPAIARSYTGEAARGVVDEISIDGRESNYRLTLVNETLGEEENEIVAVGEEGAPEDDEIPDHPGILKIGEELVVFESAESLGNAIQFNNCSRGMMRTLARSYERGTQMEILFGPIVAVLTEGIADSTNQLVGEGFDRFPYTGCARIEVPDADVAELRIYTVNKGAAVAGPIGDRGTGLFNARYGTQAMSHESGTPVFFHPVRYWDRYAMYSDHASLSFWAFHTELTDAYIKRIYWKEGRAVQRAQFRVFARLDDGIGWNASERNLIYRSQLGESSGSGIEGSRASERRRFDRAADKKAFLFVMENGRGDNYIGLQASKVDIRVFAVYRQFAYVWNNPLEIGWKATPVMQEFGIEYLQQNRVRRHIDK